MDNKKISNKKKQKMSSSDGMMLEVLNDKIDLIIEGQGSTDSRIDQLSGRFGRFEDKVTRLEIKSSITEEHFIGLEGKLMKLDGKFDRLDKKFDGLARDIHKKADKDDVTVLGRRVTKLEAI
ncbi:MAG TPA: hypothetical protein VIJ46_00810 [Rhabdochlamydiaceae bacterium]